MESKGIAQFLAAADRLRDGPRLAAVLMAAARMLDGVPSRTPEGPALAGWAGRRLEELMVSSTPSGTGITETQLLHVALALGKTGAVAAGSDLRARLDALSQARSVDDLWLWALAHDVYAAGQFKSLALAARLPRRPLLRGLGLLRLHQLTGDMRWIADANRVVAKAPRVGLPAFDTALLMAELKMPESAIVPPFLGSLRSHLNSDWNAGSLRKASRS